MGRGKKEGKEKEMNGKRQRRADKVDGASLPALLPQYGPNLTC